MGIHRAGAGGPGVYVAVSGPLAPLVDDIREELAGRGYTSAFQDLGRIDWC